MRFFVGSCCSIFSARGAATRNALVQLPAHYTQTSRREGTTITSQRSCLDCSPVDKGQQCLNKLITINEYIHTLHIWLRIHKYNYTIDISIIHFKRLCLTVNNGVWKFYWEVEHNQTWIYSICAYLYHIIQVIYFLVSWRVRR